MPSELCAAESRMRRPRCVSSAARLAPGLLLLLAGCAGTMAGSPGAVDPAVAAYLETRLGELRADIDANYTTTAKSYTLTSKISELRNDLEALRQALDADTRRRLKAEEALEKRLQELDAAVRRQGELLAHLDEGVGSLNRDFSVLSADVELLQGDNSELIATLALFQRSLEQILRDRLQFLEGERRLLEEALGGPPEEHTGLRDRAQRDAADGRPPKDG